MKNLSGSLSLPKITSKFIEDLIKQTDKSPIQRKSLKKSTYNKKHKQHFSAQNTNRFTEVDSRLGNSQYFKHNSQILDVSSPFYRKIQIKNVKSPRCQCHQSHWSQSLELPTIRKSPCHDHHEIITKKITEIKKYQQSIINSVKQNHMKIHQQIDANELKYAAQSFGKKWQIIAQKFVGSKINEQYHKNKLEKLKVEENRRKQFVKVVLKDKLEQVYNLSNENLPFEQILEKRSRWYKQKKTWAFKILDALHSQLKQVRKQKQRILQSKKQKDLAHIVQNQHILLDIEKCLAIVLNNVQSIDDLLINGNVDKVNTIFSKNLDIKDKFYGKKLCRKLSQIVERFYQALPTKNDTRPTQFSQNYHQLDKKIQKTVKFQLQNEQIAKSDEKIIKENFKRISQLQTPQKKTQRTQQCTPENDPQNNPIQNNEETSSKKERSPRVSRVSRASIKSKFSLTSKTSFQQKMFISTSKLSKKSSFNTLHFQQKQSIESNSHTNSNTQRSSKTLKSLKSLKSQVSIKSKFSLHDGSQSSANQFNQADNFKASLNSNNTKNIAPSISKHVIDEIDEFIVAQDDDDFDGDDYDKYAKEKALRFLQYSKAAKQQEVQQQNQRIDYVIDYVKARIKLRQAKKFIIPIKYQKIKYQEFCSQNTFKYITSMIDEFQDQKKFTFLYGQLKLKKKILNDSYIYDVIETFEQMFKDSEQFEKWKDYLFEQRNKMIFFKLDRMIDLGLQEIADFQFDEESNAIKEQQQPMNGCAIFNKVDQSQIDYENFILKMERQKEQQQDAALDIERDPNISLNISPHIRSEQKKLTLQETIVQQISQRTIKSDIESTSTKTILYTFVQNQCSIKPKKSEITHLNKKRSPNKSHHEDKKKVLKYLLKKRPQQFQTFTKDVNEFSKYVRSFDQKNDEMN